MKHATLEIPVSTPFSFQSALDSHGWVDLLPNTYDAATPSFSRVGVLPSGSAVIMKISAVGKEDDQKVIVSVSALKKLKDTDKSYLTAAVRHMLRLDEDFTEFSDLCRIKAGAWKDIRMGTGHLLRSPTVFEDMVKVLCTTNIQWGGTKRMVAELVFAFGKPFGNEAGQKAFPDYAAIAAVSFDEFQRTVKLGYRADYVHRLAAQFAGRELTAADFLNKEIPTGDIRKKLLSIKGFGAYAAASMLMLLGRYDHIPVDSVFQQFVTKKYFKNRPYNLPEALAIYKDWGKWQYLAYWFEMIASESS